MVGTLYPDKHWCACSFWFITRPLSVLGHGFASQRWSIGFYPFDGSQLCDRQKDWRNSNWCLGNVARLDTYYFALIILRLFVSRDYWRQDRRPYRFNWETLKHCALSDIVTILQLIPSDGVALRYHTYDKIIPVYFSQSTPLIVKYQDSGSVTQGYEGRWVGEWWFAQVARWYYLGGDGRQTGAVQLEFCFINRRPHNY